MTNTHPKGRFVLEWNSITGNREMAVYEVTGKRNDVYIQSSTRPAGWWMPRHFFEEFVEHAIKQLGGVELKPNSRSWKRISATA